ncbi:hypothetical protein D0869_11932 [Hortaea werneckii]|uniref:Stress-associated endoplasmic reticulum protein n=1 Tax=Hortaea werneckii TaxID=91943 RepID=A0A3M6W9F1_HORWE|nr:hypothetical protein D0869_11932 [Hortaea werneckii]
MTFFSTIPPEPETILDLESTLDQKGKLTRPVSFLLFQAQTPQQRRANNTFAKAEERKRGKPQGEVLRKEKPAKAPISKTWVF